MNTITLKATLEFLDSGAYFSMAVVTADKHKNKGGEWLKFDKACKFMQDAKQQNAAAIYQPLSGLQKNPNHNENRTRNILLPNGEIRKVRIRLIRRFIGKIVT